MTEKTGNAWLQLLSNEYAKMQDVKRTEIKRQRKALLKMFRSGCYEGLNNKTKEHDIWEYLKKDFEILWDAGHYKEAQGIAHYFAVICLGSTLR